MSQARTGAACMWRALLQRPSAPLPPAAAAGADRHRSLRTWGGGRHACRRARSLHHPSRHGTLRRSCAAPPTVEMMMTFFSCPWNCSTLPTCRRQAGRASIKVPPLLGYPRWLCSAGPATVSALAQAEYRPCPRRSNRPRVGQPRGPPAHVRAPSSPHAARAALAPARPTRKAQKAPHSAAGTENLPRVARPERRPPARCPCPLTGTCCAASGPAGARTHAGSRSASGELIIAPWHHCRRPLAQLIARPWGNAAGAPARRPGTTGARRRAAQLQRQHGTAQAKPGPGHPALPRRSCRGRCAAALSPP